MSLKAADGGTLDADFIGMTVASKIKHHPPITIENIEAHGIVKSAPCSSQKAL
jgi:hypothetical protein